MREKSLFYRRTLGMLIGVLIMPARLAQAQFGGVVFDPKNYALQIKKQRDDQQDFAKSLD